MTRRSRYREPLGSFGERPNATDVTMRTAILLAILELPPDLIARIANGRPRISWQDYDEARKAIAEHLVVRVRQHIRCEYDPSAAFRGHD